VIRLAQWLIVSLLVTAGIAWLIGLPGTLTVEMLGYRLQPRLGVAAFLLILGLVAFIFVWGVLKRIIGAPYYLARRARERRKDLGYAALSDGFIALQSGDANRARLLAREAQDNLPKNAAAQLLEARADLAVGDMHSAREHYRALISNRKTAIAALSGLYDQSRAQGRFDAALSFAQKALEISAQAPWAREAVFDELTRAGRWDEAKAMVLDDPTLTRDDRLRKRRRLAVVEAAQARVAEGHDPNAALEHALSALKLDANFVPATLIAARIYINRRDTRKAMSLLRRVWRATSHPDVAALFANVQPGSSAVDRVRRIQELVDLPPPNRASALVLARAAIDAFDWTLARQALLGFSSQNPTQGVCLLMSEIEDGQSGDVGKAQDWRSRSQRAPRDPCWTADGITAPEWEPVSPVSGKLDAFEWRVPASAVAVRVAPFDAPERPAAPESLARPAMPLAAPDA
jgi:HemY protein